jgi:hypothetical protein
MSERQRPRAEANAARYVRFSMDVSTSADAAAQVRRKSDSVRLDRCTTVTLTSTSRAIAEFRILGPGGGGSSRHEPCPNPERPNRLPMAGHERGLRSHAIRPGSDRSARAALASRRRKRHVPADRRAIERELREVGHRSARGARGAPLCAFGEPLQRNGLRMSWAGS